MKTRIITGLILLAVILPCVILGGIAFKILLGIVAGVAVFEMLSICNRPRAHFYLYPIVGLFVFYSLFFDQSLLISSEIMILYMIVLMACSMFDDGINFLRLSYYFTAGVLIGMGLHMLYQLRLTYGFDYILILALATLERIQGHILRGCV